MADLLKKTKSVRRRVNTSVAHLSQGKVPSADCYLHRAVEDVEDVEDVAGLSRNTRISSWASTS